MSMQAASRNAGWALIALVGAAWVLAGAATLGNQCHVECWQLQLGGIVLATLSASVLAAALWLLADSYPPDGVTASTAAAFAAKVGRMVGRAPYLLVLASFVLMFVLGPLGLLVAVWNVASSAFLSEGAQRLDRRTRSDLVSDRTLCIVAAAFVVWLLLLVRLAAPAVYG